jgi:hemerythrin
MNRIRYHLIRAHVSAHTAFVALDKSVQRRRATARENGAVSVEIVVIIVALMATAVIVAAAYRSAISEKVKQFTQ